MAQTFIMQQSQVTATQFWLRSCRFLPNVAELSHANMAQTLMMQQLQMSAREFLPKLAQLVHAEMAPTLTKRLQLNFNLDPQNFGQNWQKYSVQTLRKPGGLGRAGGGPHALFDGCLRSCKCEDANGSFGTPNMRSPSQRRPWRENPFVGVDWWSWLNEWSMLACPKCWKHVHPFADQCNWKALDMLHL